MKKIIATLILATIIPLNSFFFERKPRESRYDVEGIINSKHLPETASILAEAFKAAQDNKELKQWLAAQRFNTEDLSKTAAIYADIAAQMKLPPEALEFLKASHFKINSDFKIDSKDLQTMKLEMGLNAQTAALLKELLKGVDFKDFKDFKLSQVLDKDITLKHEAVIDSDTAFRVTGIISAILAGYMFGLVVHKHVTKDDAHFTKADGVATCASVALAVGAWALIKYSATLAGAA